jgi:hypothetical protein
MSKLTPSEQLELDQRNRVVRMPKRLCKRIALPKWPKSHEYEPAKKQIVKRSSPPMQRLNPPSFDQSNRYVTPSTRTVGTRNGHRNEYAPKVGSKAHYVGKIRAKGQSRRDRWRAQVAARKAK